MMKHDYYVFAGTKTLEEQRKQSLLSLRQQVAHHQKEVERLTELLRKEESR